MRPYTSLVVFVGLLIVLRRMGLQVSIIGSLLITLAVSLIMRWLEQRGRE